MKITKINKKLAEITVDIEVEKTHSYQLENGWVSHNTVSQIAHCGSGSHVWYSRYILRRYRISATDPLALVLKECGFKLSAENGQDKDNPSTWVVTFPVEAPKNSLTRADVTVIDQLEHYKKIQNNWCVTGDTDILTDKGHIPIKDLVGSLVNIWNGESFEPVTPFETGKQKIYLARFTNGIEIKCTEDHKFILEDGSRKELKDLLFSDKLKPFSMPVVDFEDSENVEKAYSQGFYSGDGFSNSNFSHIFHTKYMCIPRLVGEVKSNEFKSRRAKQWKHGEMLSKTYVPMNQSINYKLNWLAGVLDSDGNKHGKGLQITSIDKGFLEKLRLMLTLIGVNSKIQHKHDGIIKEMPSGKNNENKEYLCKPLYSLSISSYYTRQLINLGLKTERVELLGSETNSERRVKLKSVEEFSKEMTFCFTEEKTNRGTFNGMVIGQCEHNQSTTIYVKDEEWIDVGKWVYENWDSLVGLSFLPYDGGIYEQPPLEEITKEQYDVMVKEMPEIDYSLLAKYELEDMTQGKSELACVSGSCDIPT